VVVDIEKVRLPQFLGLGAQKAGTTSLHHMLAGHPDVFLPPAKELQFFSLHHRQGPEWYQAQFEHAQPGQVCGEISPYYLFHPLVPQRIRALLPHARCIALLRDPVERCLSHYFHACRLGFETLPLAQALAAESQRLEHALERLSHGEGRDQAHQELSYLSRSRYEQQLQRYEPWRSQGRLLLLRSEDLFANPTGSWERIQVFLELQPVTLRTPLPTANGGAGEARGVDAAIRQELRALLRHTYEVLAEEYGLSWP
jgi:hypothetical protein